MKKQLLWLLTLFFSLSAPAQNGLKTPALAEEADLPEQIDYRVVNAYPHHEQASTQGIVFSDGYLYESTGLFGASSLRKTDLVSGKVIELQPLDSRHFGEGLTLYRNNLYQLTWRSGSGHIYDKKTLERGDIFYYSGEGWGLTHTGREFVMSDGSSQLQFLDTETMKPVRQLQVTDERGPVMRLNELEFVDGLIYANVLYETRIARIHPGTGKVTGWIKLDGLIELNSSPEDETSTFPGALNGIAWDSQDKRLFVTGKHWPYVFEIELIDGFND